MLHRTAISIIDTGWRSMRVHAFETGRSHVVRSTSKNRYFAHSTKVGKAALWRVERVAVSRLDTLLLRVGQIDLLKVDVEGMELAAICSALALLVPDRVRHLGLEFNQETLPDEEVICPTDG